MQQLYLYIRSYFGEIFNWRTAAPLLIWIVLCTIASYVYKADDYTQDLFNLPLYTLHHVVLYTLTFILPYTLYLKLNRVAFKEIPTTFWLLLGYAVLLFSFRSAWQVSEVIRIRLWQHENGYYWYKIIQSMQRTLLMCTGIAAAWWVVHRKEQPLYGISKQKFTIQPYLIMLGAMVPLILMAGTLSDFLEYYPRANRALKYLPQDDNILPWALGYELVYGLDFFAIEFFFRGFLILAFAPYVGRYCILPVAVFYESIHFQKPLGECISSLFGGVLLGIITYETRSIWGGVIVHIGIAWMMEAVAFAMR